MNSSEIILQIFINAIKQKGITEKECLISCNINTSFFTDWKRRPYSKPSYDKIIILANYLEIDLNYLFNNNDTSFGNTLSEKEKDIITFFRSLNDFDKGMIYGEMKSKFKENSSNKLKDAN